MRNLIFISCIPLLLSLNLSSQKPKISKEIIGIWVFHYYGKIGDSKVSLGWAKTKKTENPYEGYEFRKKGELIVNRDKFAGCGNGPAMFESILGKWSQISDSSVTITYTDEDVAITQSYYISYDKTWGTQLKLIH